jgi:hypothetical protein
MKTLKKKYRNSKNVRKKIYGPRRGHDLRSVCVSIKHVTTYRLRNMIPVDTARVCSESDGLTYGVLQGTNHSECRTSVHWRKTGVTGVLCDVKRLVRQKDIA